MDAYGFDARGGGPYILKSRVVSSSHQSLSFSCSLKLSLLGANDCPLVLGILSGVYAYKLGYSLFLTCPRKMNRL